MIAFIPKDTASVFRFGIGGTYRFPLLWYITAVYIETSKYRSPSVGYSAGLDYEKFVVGTYNLHEKMSAIGSCPLGEVSLYFLISKV